jgi:hypothetical protein
MAVSQRMIGVRRLANGIFGWEGMMFLDALKIVALGSAVAVLSWGPVFGEHVVVDFDLWDGLLDHDAPDALESPNGEIEDQYRSSDIAIDPAVEILPFAAGLRDAVIEIQFRDKTNGRRQWLEVAAEGTIFPFPDTFTKRFFGAETAEHPLPTPSQSWDGMGFSYGGRSNSGDDIFVQGSGWLHVSLTDVAGELVRNVYVVELACGPGRQCFTGAHYPLGEDVVLTHPATGCAADPATCFQRRTQDLTDGTFRFGGIIVRPNLDAITSCTSVHSCRVLIEHFYFNMLAGDLTIVEE